MPGMGGQESMADRIFPMMDRDQDGVLSLDEFSVMGGPEPQAAETFAQMDQDQDGTISRSEAEVFFAMMEQSMGGPGGMGGGPGMGGPGMRNPNQPDPPMADYDSDVIDDPDDYGEEDELPAQDEL